MIIVGLGNNGAEYEATHHNAGFLFLDFLAARLDLEWKNNPYIQGSVAQSSGKEYVLVKPDGFMNESGRIVAPLVKFYAQENSLSFYVAHDDADIPFGSYKITDDGPHGAAGHHGVESVLSAALRHGITPRRIRIGTRDTGSDTQNREKAGSFALKKISEKNRETLSGVFEKIAETISSVQ